MPFPFLETTNDYTPINDIKPVTPNDSADLPNGPCRALIFTNSGSVTLVTYAGTTVTLSIGTTWFGVQYIRAKRILNTGTSATGIFACY